MAYKHSHQRLHLLVGLDSMCDTAFLSATCIDLVAEHIAAASRMVFILNPGLSRHETGSNCYGNNIVTCL